MMMMFMVKGLFSKLMHIFLETSLKVTYSMTQFGRLYKIIVLSEGMVMLVAYTLIVIAGYGSNI